MEGAKSHTIRSTDQTLDRPHQLCHPDREPDPMFTGPLLSYPSGAPAQTNIVTWMKSGMLSGRARGDFAHQERANPAEASSPRFTRHVMWKIRPMPLDPTARRQHGTE